MCCSYLFSNAGMSRKAVYKNILRLTTFLPLFVIMGQSVSKCRSDGYATCRNQEREVMARIVKKFLRKKNVKILLIFSVFVSFVLIFCSDSTSRKKLWIFERCCVFQKEKKIFLKINDLFISVKTTLSFHKTRLKLLLDTWISTCKNQVSRYIYHVTGKGRIHVYYCSVDLKKYILHNSKHSVSVLFRILTDHQWGGIICWNAYLVHQNYYRMNFTLYWITMTQECLVFQTLHITPEM
jgi:hypothetical protein